MTLIENQVNSNDFQWGGRPVRLQERFLVLRKLGQGTYGKVQLALNKETNQEVAIKTIKKARIESEEDMLRIRREIQIMASIRHPHIIHINEVFETRQKIVIVMQYASGGELYDYLGCHQKLPEIEARRIFRQIASAIYYCHKNRICHRDLKLENILLDEEGNAQIADFGLSNIFDDRRRMSTFCGSPLYASPEIVKGTPYKGPEVDCWSLGVLLYTLIYGTMPFDGRNFKELVSQISAGKYEEPMNKSNASTLIRSLLTPEISKRATISDVCKDKWVNDGYKDSLLKLADQMALENHLNGENLIATQLCLENNTKNGLYKNSLSKTNNFTEPRNGKINLRSVLKNCVGHNEVNRGVSDKPTLYEQILSYDVRFVINKLLTAVESSLTVLNGNSNIKFQNPVKEKPSLKTWTRNGDTTAASKVDSAYVIPIFEVTSIVPKSSSKNIPFSFNKMNTKQFLGTQNNTTDMRCEASSLISHKKITKVKIKKKDEEQTNETSTIPKIEISCEIQDVNRTDSTAESEIAVTNMPPKNINDHIRCPDNQNKISIINHTHKLDNFEEEYKLIVNQENIPRRIPSPKTKRRDESIFHNKLSPFFRTGNHALNLAHLFSLNFEKFNLNSLKVPERRQKKSPGKITIPATFDPTTAPRIICERKEILLFPTISVSENKEKIEKKIDKIKKAALNMNLIRRSNSKNRLKIQKYLKSQAKKIQDLVSDEQRSKNNSVQKIRKCETFSAISDTHFRVRYFNSINIRQQNKKINFLSPNSCFGEATNKWNLNSDQNTRWKLSISGNNTQDMEYNFNLFNLSKSKSDEMKVLNTYPTYSISHEDMRSCVLDTDLSDLDMKSLSQFSKLFRPKTNSSEMSMKDDHDQRMTVTKMSEFCTNIKLNSDEPHNSTAVPSNSSLGNQNSWDEKVSNQQSYDGIVPNNFQDTSTETNNLNNIYHTDSDCLNVGYERKASLSECIKNNSWARSKTENPSQNGARMKRLSSEPCFGRYKHSNSSCELSEHRILSSDNTRTIMGEINKRESSKKSGLSRRNTFGCLTDFTSNNKHTFRKESRGSMSVKRDDFQDYLFMMYVNKKLQRLNSQNNLEFLNHPDLCNFHQERSLMHFDSKSVHEISRKLYEASLSDTPVYGLNEAKSAFLRKLLQNQDSIHVKRSHTGTRASRIKSVSEEVLTHNENSDYLRKTQSERKLSLPQGLPMDQNESRKIPFLSNFLNELEKREPLKGIKDKPFTRRQYSRNTLVHDKKLRKENRSKSFLQLLSLKRIQEAEKELDRIERPDSLEKEDENSGSLLEALKTHGYKNVISQRFQVEDNSNDISFRHSKNSYFSRIPDIPRTYLSNYDNILHNGTSTYDYTEYDELDGFASPFHLETNCNPRFPKQYVQDWLTTNLNEKYMDSSRMERNGPITPEKQIQTMNALDKRCMWEKESSKSYEDDPSSSESFELTKDIYSNGIFSNDFGRVNDDLINHSNVSGYSNIERNHLLRTSSTSEDEKEESVQDRIWRKSFYSRFNNSVLSRKDKSKFIDSDLLLEKSGLVNGNSRLLSSPRERADSLQWNTVYKNSSLKRAATLKPSLSKKNSFDSSSINSLKLKSKSFKHSLSEEAPQVKKDTTDEKNQTEPEH